MSRKQPLLDEYESIKTELKDIHEKKPCSVQKPAGLKKVRNPLIIFFQIRKAKLWEKGYCTVKTWEWRDYFGHETNQPRNGIILWRFTRNKTIWLSFYEFQRELFRLCWGPRHSQIVFWGISVSWIWPDIKNVWTFFQNNKSPLEDGFSKEFYETFFDLIGTYLLNSYNEAFTKGQLSISQRRGIICLIPKEDSCLIELSNWQPLTFLNVDYKILTKKVSYYLLIFVKPSTPLNGILSTSVLNYTTLAQILQNGYSFFIIMLKVAWWTRVSWLITSKSLEVSRVSHESSFVCASGRNGSPQNTPNTTLPGQWKWLYWICILWLSISFEIMWQVSSMVVYTKSMSA